MRVRVRAGSSVTHAWVRLRCSARAVASAAIAAWSKLSPNCRPPPSPPYASVEWLCSLPSFALCCPPGCLPVR